MDPHHPGSERLTAEKFLRIALNYAKDDYEDGCDFAISAEYHRMVIRREDGQEVEVEGFLTQLTNGMTVLIKAGSEDCV